MKIAKEAIVGTLLQKGIRRLERLLIPQREHRGPLRVTRHEVCPRIAT